MRVGISLGKEVELGCGYNNVFDRGRLLPPLS